MGPWLGEVMSPESSSIPRISDLTLALLEARLGLEYSDEIADGSQQHLPGQRLV